MTFDLKSIPRINAGDTQYLRKGCLLSGSYFSFERETLLAPSAPPWQPEICHTAKPTLPCQPENPHWGTYLEDSVCTITFARRGYRTDSKKQRKTQMLLCLSKDFVNLHISCNSFCTVCRQLMTAPLGMLICTQLLQANQYQVNTLRTMTWGLSIQITVLLFKDCWVSETAC